MGLPIGFGASPVRSLVPRRELITLLRGTSLDYWEALVLRRSPTFPRHSDPASRTLSQRTVGSSNAQQSRCTDLGRRIGEHTIPAPNQHDVSPLKRASVTQDGTN